MNDDDADSRDDVDYEKKRKRVSKSNIKVERKKERGSKFNLKSMYIGESSCSVYKRGKEHLNAYKDLNEQSYMLKHAILAH